MIRLRLLRITVLFLDSRLHSKVDSGWQKYYCHYAVHMIHIIK